jgi:hypothetical protein
MGSVRVAIRRFITLTPAVAAISIGVVVVVHVLPAAGAPQPTPTLTTAVSEPNGLVDDQISDTVTLAGTDGAPATLAWNLYGPAQPDSSGTCATADWTGAANRVQGNMSVSGDSTETVGSFTVAKAGCYSYAISVTSPSFASVDSPVGQPSETVQIEGAVLTVTTSEAPSSPGVLTAVGQIVPYDFVITNTAATQITVFNATILDAQSVAGEELTSGPTCPTGQPIPGQPMITSLLSPGDSETCTATYTVTQTDFQNGYLTNSAIATALDSNGNVSTSDPSTLTLLTALVTALPSGTSAAAARVVTTSPLSRATPVTLAATGFDIEKVLLMASLLIAVGLGLTIGTSRRGRRSTHY